MNEASRARHNKVEESGEGRREHMATGARYAEGEGERKDAREETVCVTTMRVSPRTT